MDEYKKILPAIFQKHPATFLVNPRRYEVTEPVHKNESIGEPEFSFDYASGAELQVGDSVKPILPTRIFDGCFITDRNQSCRLWQMMVALPHFFEISAQQQ